MNVPEFESVNEIIEENSVQETVEINAETIKTMSIEEIVKLINSDTSMIETVAETAAETVVAE